MIKCKKHKKRDIMTKPYKNNFMTKEHGKLILERVDEIILELKEARAELKSDISNLKGDVKRLDKRMDNLESDVSDIKGMLKELLSR